MSNLVLNERACAEYAIANNVLGDKPIETLNMVSRYYYSVGYKKSDIPAKLEDFIVRCDPSINIIKLQDVIERQAKNSDKYPLIDIQEVTVTSAEMKIIDSLNNRRLRRLLFTLVCLAKYYNQINPANKNWINRQHKEVFKMANIEATNHVQSLMLNDLMNMGYIRFSKIVDNININVLITDYESPVILSITDFRNLGNQYNRYKGEPYFECQSCGVVVRHNSNRQRYCKSCADEINKQKTLSRIRDQKFLS